MNFLIVCSSHTSLPSRQFQATACFSTALKLIVLIFLKGFKNRSIYTKKKSNRDICGLQSLKYLLSGLLQKTFVNSCIMNSQKCSFWVKGCEHFWGFYCIWPNCPPETLKQFMSFSVLSLVTCHASCLKGPWPKSLAFILSHLMVHYHFKFSLPLKICLAIYIFLSWLS